MTRLENGYMVNDKHFDEVSLLCRGQESVLHIGPAKAQTHRAASLWFLNFSGKEIVTIQPIGDLRSASRREAMTHDSWTYCPELNTYFITEVKDVPTKKV